MYNHVKREARQYFILLRGLLVLSLEAIYRIQLKGCSNISTFLSRCCQDTESILELSSSVVYFCRAARLPWCPTCHDAMSGSRYISLKINEPVNFTKLLLRCFEYWNKTKVEMFFSRCGNTPPGIPRILWRQIQISSQLQKIYPGFQYKQLWRLAQYSGIQSLLSDEWWTQHRVEIVNCLCSTDQDIFL